MKRRNFLLAPLALSALATLPLPALAEPLKLPEISRYINGIGQLRARFTQINDDGTIASGTLYLKRPGRIRFEYDPPERSLVMAGGGQVAVFDARSNQPPEQYPLARTPLKLILDRNVDLSRANMVKAFEYDGTSTMIVAQDPQHPEYGNIRLKFTGPPVELRQWIITSGDGTRTTVTLNDVQHNAPMGSQLFNIPIEIRKRGR